MPILLRIIAQRTIAVFLTFLTFLGLSPEAKIPTTEQVEFRIEEQKRIVEQILELKNTEITASGYESENIIKVIDDAAQKINERTEELENAPTTEIKIDSKTEPKLAPKIEPKKEAPAVTRNPFAEIEVPPTQKVEVTIPKEGQMKNLADVMVNIICTQKSTGFTKASTGSGVLISPTGTIITNAHVAQFFLLEDAGGKIECAIYRENIPTFGYRADLIYISPTWVKNNKNIMLEDNPKGTGEKDYAFLQITENTNPVLGLPSQFSYAPVLLDSDIYTEGRKISIGGFPGSPISVLDLAKAGSLKTDNSSIKDVFTIDGKDVDIFSTEKTPVAAKGASGGGIFYNNNLIGITVTISKEGSGSKINAITTKYIDSDLYKESGFNIGDMIGEQSHIIKQSFKKTMLEDLAGSIYQDL